MNFLNSVIEIMSSKEVQSSYEEIRKESIYYSDLFEENNHLKEYEEYVSQAHAHSQKVD